LETTSKHYRKLIITQSAYVREEKLDYLRTHFYVPLSILLLTIIVVSQFVCSSLDPLSLTVTTSKLTYLLGENVKINGSLTIYGQPIPNGFVAIQVDYPSTGGCLTVRTRDTGTGISNPDVEILQLFPSDGWGNPRYSFPKGTTEAYFTIKWRNNDVIPHQVAIVLSLYDATNAPFRVWTPIEGLMYPGEENGTFQVNIPDNIAFGEAKVYGSALSTWPKNGGRAYCQEKFASFSITETSAMSTRQISQEVEPGTYDLTFFLPTNRPTGIYTVYVGCYYGQQLTNTTTFEEKTRLLGDVTGDSVVDGEDVAIVIYSVPSYPGHRKWNPAADINIDGVVDGVDTAIVIANVGHHA